MLTRLRPFFGDWLLLPRRLVLFLGLFLGLPPMRFRRSELTRGSAAETSPPPMPMSSIMSLNALNGD